MTETKIKQTVTFVRQQSITLEFELDQPISNSEAHFWANFGYNQGSILDQIAEGKVKTPIQRMDLGKWEPVTAQPDFRPEDYKPQLPRRRRKKQP